jgi:uncharacterized damage-inducible protein DinB
MQNLDWLKELFRHMIWADRQIWEALQKFPKAAHNNDIKEKLCHIHQAQLAFYQIWMGMPLDIPELSSFTTLQNMIKWAADNHTKILNFVEKIDAAKLDKEIKLPWAKSVAKRFDFDPQPCTLLDSMQQVIQHSTYHRGQINSIIRALGEEPPVTDFILWVLKGKP